VYDLESRIYELVRDARNDPRTTGELISRALSEQDEDVRWEIVALLHRRGTRVELDAAVELCRSQCDVERILGADLLGQLGVPTRTFPDEAIEVLLALIQREEDEGVLQSVCVALGFTPDARAIPELTRLASHPCEDVRHDVAYALGGIGDRIAIGTFIKLTTDSCASVRDWALFALGRQIDDDTPEIREALFQGLSDPDGDARGEAMYGLARRGDNRVIESLIAELNYESKGDCYSYALEALDVVADPRLLPTLHRLKASSQPGEDGFDHAISRCSESSENQVR
jgi:HEAT repeat protein